MKVLAAYMLCVLGGNAAPDADAIKKVLASAEAEADDASIDALLKGLEGKDLNEVLAAGKEKLSKFGGGGGGGGGSGGAGGAAAAEEEKEEEEEEEEEVDMGGAGGLFGAEEGGGDY